MQQGDATTAAPRRQVAMTSRKGRIGLGTTDGSIRRGTPEWREMRKRGGSFGAHRDRRRRLRGCSPAAGFGHRGDDGDGCPVKVTLDNRAACRSIMGT
ncbi:hypothetical protein E2562_012626 [Oryza meyeriana var. granulata]|uniref:Uncharacterized protein n=1 Tax=Oryza meyeriana var. granulata TaxID=110450 RepID=A0A6G1CFG1_9ORYZ|nr:hypothetical protein E2562_012626 [Oryza meyeriana var. granulata]